MGRMLNYGSFMIAGSLVGLAIKRPDVVYVWHPPLTVGVIASVMSALRGVPFVYDVQDIWPDSAIVSGMLRDGRAAAFIRGLEVFAYQHAARVLVVTDGARANLVAKQVPTAKLTVLPHWYDPVVATIPDERARAWAREFLVRDERFIVTFAGNLGLLQDLGVLLDAAKQLAASSRIGFRIVGDGSDRRRLEQRARDLALTNVRFLGPRPPADMSAIFAESDALLVQLRAGPVNDLVVPSKTQAYLAAGRPIIAAVEGAAAQIVRDARAGVVVPPGDPTALASAVDALSRTSSEELRQMGESGRQYAQRNFAKDNIMGEIEKLLLAASRA